MSSNDITVPTVQGATLSTPNGMSPPVDAVTPPTTESVNSEPLNTFTVEGQPVYPAVSKHRVHENIRGEIVMNLMWLVAGQIGFACLVLAFDKMTVTEVKDLLMLLFTPTLVLLGAAAGFFYAGRQA